MHRYLIVAVLLAAPLVQANDITRYATPGARIASAIEVNGVLFHSGVIPQAANPDAEQNSPEFWGDTYTQAHNVLSRIRDSLDEKGYAMADVVKMTVFLVGDPALGGRMDFQGFNRAYGEFFGEPTGGLVPARSTVEISGLVAPNMLVEIEVIAAATP
jgi:enamine deaminase RidA (YjgF/YER057c/UK114 family)